MTTHLAVVVSGPGGLSLVGGFARRDAGSGSGAVAEAVAVPVGDRVFERRQVRHREPELTPELQPPILEVLHLAAEVIVLGLLLQRHEIVQDGVDLVLTVLDVQVKLVQGILSEDVVRFEFKSRDEAIILCNLFLFPLVIFQVVTL